MNISGGELGDIVPGVVLVEVLLVLLHLVTGVEEGRAVARIAVVETWREVDILVGTLALTVAVAC